MVSALHKTVDSCGLLGCWCQHLTLAHRDVGALQLEECFSQTEMLALGRVVCVLYSPPPSKRSWDFPHRRVKKDEWSVVSSPDEGMSSQKEMAYLAVW